MTWHVDVTAVVSGVLATRILMWLDGYRRDPAASRLRRRAREREEL